MLARVFDALSVSSLRLPHQHTSTYFSLGNYSNSLVLLCLFKMDKTRMKLATFFDQDDEESNAIPVRPGRAPLCPAPSSSFTRMRSKNLWTTRN